jgi:hypothetical protein
MTGQPLANWVILHPKMRNPDYPSMQATCISHVFVDDNVPATESADKWEQENSSPLGYKRLAVRISLPHVSNLCCHYAGLVCW